MKRSKLDKYIKEFEAAEKRWKAMEPGQVVYDQDGWGDYFKVIIEEVHVEERYIVGLDMSQGGNRVELDELSPFRTIPELKEIGVELVWD